MCLSGPDDGRSKLTEYNSLEWEEDVSGEKENERSGGVKRAGRKEIK